MGVALCGQVRKAGIFPCLSSLLLPAVIYQPRLTLIGAARRPIDSSQPRRDLHTAGSITQPGEGPKVCCEIAGGLPVQRNSCAHEHADNRHLLASHTSDEGAGSGPLCLSQDSIFRTVSGLAVRQSGGEFLCLEFNGPLDSC